MRLGRGFQPGAFQSNAFQMPDRGGGGGSRSSSGFWQAMLLAEDEQERRNKKRKRELIEAARIANQAAPVMQPARVALRFVTVEPRIDLSALVKRLPVVSYAQEEAEFLAFMQVIAKGLH